MRAAYARAYESGEALTAGFSWYRAFPQDAKDNEKTKGEPLSVPLLYLRGEHDARNMGAYLEGFRGAGVRQLEAGIISGAGHFMQEEAPESTWDLIARFAGVER
jgi:pimeloyl-ACP methyl ester carboxylesterase